jgi:hypothetical protein
LLLSGTSISFISHDRMINSPLFPVFLPFLAIFLLIPLCNPNDVIALVFLHNMLVDLAIQFSQLLVFDIFLFMLPLKQVVESVAMDDASEVMVAFLVPV